VDAGGLVSYGPDAVEMYRHAAIYVNRIFKAWLIAIFNEVRIHHQPQGRQSARSYDPTGGAAARRQVVNGLCDRR
jgi:hypothetical protein